MKIKTLLLATLITALAPISTGYAKVTYYDPAPIVEVTQELTEAKEFAKSVTVIVGTEEAKGTGVFVGKGIVLTAAHVIEDGTRITVTDAEGTVFTHTEVLLSDAWKDLALIKVGTTANTYMDVAERKLAVAQQLFNVGHTLEHNFTVADAKVTATRAAVAFRSRIAISGDVHPGNSGGPLVNDAGELVGIVLAVPRDENGYNSAVAYAANVKTINGFLAEALASN